MLAFFSIVYFAVQNFPGYSHHVVDHVKGSHHIPCMPQTSERKLKSCLIKLHGYVVIHQPFVSTVTMVPGNSRASNLIFIELLTVRPVK